MIKMRLGFRVPSGYSAKHFSPQFLLWRGMFPSSCRNLLSSRDQLSRSSSPREISDALVGREVRIVQQTKRAMDDKRRFRPVPFLCRSLRDTLQHKLQRGLAIQRTAAGRRRRISFVSQSKLSTRNFRKVSLTNYETWLLKRQHRADYIQRVHADENGQTQWQ